MINNGCPTGAATLGAPTFASRKQFIQGQSGQAPIGFHILKQIHTCTDVVIRWRVQNPAAGTPNEVTPEQQVTGIIIIETVPNSKANTDQPFLIQTVYSEFNSGAWLYDLGLTRPVSDCSA